MNKIDTTNWKEFEIQELFSYEVGDTDILKKHLDEKGEIVLSSGFDNQGIFGKTTIPAKIIKKNSITIDMFGNVFCRNFEYKMVTHSRIFALIPKTPKLFTQNNLLFITTIISILIKSKYDYNEMATWNKLKKEKIKLPIISDGTPDFEYMENFIKTLETRERERVRTIFQGI